MAISRYNEADLPGTVYLISSNGKMLRLPIPSNSPNDPLGWSNKKRLLAKISLMIFYIAGMVLVMVPGSKLKAFTRDIDLSVRYWESSLKP